MHSDLPKPRPHTQTRLHTVFKNALESRNGTSRDSNGRLRVTIVSAVLPLQPTREHEFESTLAVLTTRDQIGGARPKEQLGGAHDRPETAGLLPSSLAAGAPHPPRRAC
jgi:hypothetical protein